MTRALLGLGVALTTACTIVLPYEPFDGAGGSGGTGTGELGCVALSSWADGLEPTRELFVDPDGDDAADGSRSAPLATLGQALQIATPGTAIRLLPGTHQNALRQDFGGEEGAPIWITSADPEDRAVIASGTVGIHLRRTRYVVIDGLEIRGVTDAGIQIDDGKTPGMNETSHHLIVRNVDIHDLDAQSGGCVILEGVADFLVAHAELSRCGAVGFGNGVRVISGRDGRIVRNDILDLTTTGVAVQAGSENVEVLANHFIGAGDRAIQFGGGSEDSYRPPLDPASTTHTEGKNLRAVANLVEGSQSPFALIGCVQCSLLNNTVIDPREVAEGKGWLLRIGSEAPDGFTFLPPQQATVANNLFYFQIDQLQTTLNVASDVAGVEMTYTFSHNLWYAHDDPAASAPDLQGATETAGIVGQDPLLAPDFSIDGASPAAEAGADRSELTGDRIGRCYGEPPSIGAFEVSGR